MSTAPAAKRGQAGGIAVSAQLPAATVGIAVFRTLFSMTNDFQVVLLADAVFTLLVFVIALNGLERS